MPVPATVLSALTANGFTKLIDKRPTRKWLYIQNRSNSDVYLFFDANPWVLSFDGTDDYVSMDGLVGDERLMSATTGSILARIKITTASQVKTIFALSDTNANEYLAFYVDAAGLLGASLRKAAAVKWTLLTNAAVDATDWITVKLVHNGTNAILYVNGVAVPQTFTVATTKAAWIGELSGIDNARIGANYFNSTEQNFFDGRIEDVKVNAAVYANGADWVKTAHWPFDEGTGTSVADGETGYTGTVQGATWACRDAALFYLGSGFNWDQSSGFIPGTVWAYTADSGVTIATTEGF